MTTSLEVAVAERRAADHAAQAAAWSGVDACSRQEPAPLQLTLGAL